MKQITETKVTCQACGNVSYYGKQEYIQNRGKEMENCGNSMQNTGDDMMCCGGCVPAGFTPRKAPIPTKDFNKCPKCNSSAIKKEVVTHNVE